MFKSTGSGMNKAPSGGYGSHGKPKKQMHSKPSVTTGHYASEKHLTGRVYKPELLNVQCPKTQMKGHVTNRNGKAP